MIRTYLYAAGAAAFIGLLILVYFKGKEAGKIDQLKATVQAERTRKDVDQETARLGDYELCLRVGGVPEQCDELRGVEGATPAQ